MPSEKMDAHVEVTKWSRGLFVYWSPQSQDWWMTEQGEEGGDSEIETELLVSEEGFLKMYLFLFYVHDVYLHVCLWMFQVSWNWSYKQL